MCKCKLFKHTVMLQTFFSLHFSTLKWYLFKYQIFGKGKAESLRKNTTGAFKEQTIILQWYRLAMCAGSKTEWLHSSSRRFKEFQFFIPIRRRLKTGLYWLVPEWKSWEHTTIYINSSELGNPKFHISLFNKSCECICK